MAGEPTVFIIDDEEHVRKSLALLMESVHLRTETYGSAREFLEACDPSRPGCMVLDVRMPGMSGLELLERLPEKGITLPVIVITGYGDVPMAIRAMRCGALDMIEKPYRDQTLLERVQEAIEVDARARREKAMRDAIAARFALLTRGEREVMDLVTAGLANKDVAARLGLGTKAIEARRAKVMSKMQANSLAELVRMAIVLQDP